MQAPPYNITTNFEDETEAQVSGRSTLRTPQLDIELQNIEITLDALCGNLALIQADDGTLVDGIVDMDQLSENAILLLSGGGTPANLAAANAARDAAIAAQGFAQQWAIQPEDVPVNDGVHSGFSSYHWAQKAQGIVIGGAAGAAVAVSFTPTGTISANNVQSAIVELDAETQAQLALKAPLASPVFTGVPAGPSADPVSPPNANQLATVTFVANRINYQVAFEGYAKLASPAFSGAPTGPTATVFQMDGMLANTLHVYNRVVDYAPAKNGTNAFGTWPINISGNATTANTAGTAAFATDAAHAGDAAFATTAGNGGVTSLQSLTGGITLTGNPTAIDAGGGFGIQLNVAGNNIDIQMTRPTGSPNSSLHPDSEIEMSDGKKKWLRDIRLGDIVRGRDGPAEVLGIWTNILMERALFDVNGVACTPGHLFVTRKGWGAPSPEHYKTNSFGRKRAVKSRTGMIMTECKIARPQDVEKIILGTEILHSDGSWKPVTRFEHYSTGGKHIDITDNQPVYALLLKYSNCFYCDNYLVATLA